jgi:hypothetical protein
MKLTAHLENGRVITVPFIYSREDAALPFEQLNKLFYSLVENTLQSLMHLAETA